MRRALARLTWSLTPHPPAGAFAAPDLARPRRLRPSPGEPGQDLHLNRAMLSDQGSPYVGRFARGWHRLPEIVSGQPQTRTRARPSIGTGALGGGGGGTIERHASRRGGTRPRERSRGCQHVDVYRAGVQERIGRRRGRGAGGEDVIDDQHGGRDPSSRPNGEGSAHGRPPPGGIAPGLRTAGDRPGEQPGAGGSRPPGNTGGKDARLIEAALGQSPASERHPRDDLGRGYAVDLNHRARQRCTHTTPARELQPMDRPAGGTFEPERSAGGLDLIGRAVPAAIHRPEPRPAAPTAPGRQKWNERAATLVAERPGPIATTRTALREDDVERSPQHPANATAGDRHPSSNEIRARTLRAASPPPWLRSPTCAGTSTADTPRCGPCPTARQT